MDLYFWRKSRNTLMMSLCVMAAFIGISFLSLILLALLWNGVAGLNLSVFFADTPGPGSEGGLRNAIIGSLMLTCGGVCLGTPIGLLAGTWMAEYGQHSRLTSIIRFINDILLSAPSIIIGLFLFQVIVVPLGHFSALAGILSLAVIVIPIVVRTTEDMLLLVPASLREAAQALGLPRYYVITKIAYKAARTGLITGILLAIARVSGETAPLLFTSLSSPFFSLDIFKEMASLPVVINNYAGSPYENWRQLAWTGALIITLAVLSLSVIARLIAGSKDHK